MTLDVGQPAEIVGIRALLDDNPIVGEARSGPRRFWTGREEKILRGHFSQGGVAFCLPLLPGRSATAIYQRASILGLQAPGTVRRGGVPRERWESSPQIDAVIRNVYGRAPSSRSELKDLSRTLGRPYWWVGKRARKLGLVSPRFKTLPWTEAEDELIAANAARDPAVIRRMLKRKNFERTETAITVRLKRIGQPSGRNADLDHYTANGLAVLFGVDCKTVTRWIDQGWLKAGRRGTDRVAAQGGDEHAIHRRNVRRFIVENVAAVDIRKVEKFWFVELLAGGG